MLALAAAKRQLRVARWGETLALWWLRWRGFKLEARNWRSRWGEVDLVMRKGSLVVFVEVKARRSASAGPPELAVTTAKQRRLARLAQAFCRGKQAAALSFRFDVVAVDLGRFPPKLRHYPGAFVLPS
ncbi:MAG: YraN family protein [Thermoanaerobaculum sp.]|nr:YraN family protein [Thermoanaerobaculum sp.]